MRIRNAKPADLEQVIALEQASYSPEEQIAPSVLKIYVEQMAETCLIMEDESGLVGFLLASPSQEKLVNDRIFTYREPVTEGTYLAIASLVVSSAYKGQGIGTLLLAGLKEVAVAGQYQGISLTCKDYLLGFYEVNQFEDLGPSQSQFGGSSWYDMYWKAQ